MIRFFMFLLAALGIGGLLSVILGDDNGYVLVSFQGYSFETSLVVLTIILLFSLLFLYVLLWLINLLNPFSYISQRGGLFSSRAQAAKATEEGFMLLAEGRSKEAYKMLLENARKAPIPVINYMTAAQAAYELQDVSGIRFCLAEAEKASNDSTLAIGVTKARLEIDAGRQEIALAQLQSLHKRNPAHPGVLRLLSDVYADVGAWFDLSQLLPTLKKQKILSAEKFTELEIRVARQRLQLFDCGAGQVSQLDAIWQSVPRERKVDQALLGTYVHKLIELSEYDRAQVLLIQFFKHHWSDGLVKMLGYVKTNEPAQQLVLLEKLMQSRPNNAVLALTLGRVSLRNKLWGKGQDYFEAALRVSQDDALSAEINAELARFFEHTGEHDKSVACYMKSMVLVDRQLPDLPFPE